uniref:Uncharacterized protein n=1 Tax=Cucumis melo TaxID=3656 RepID=A0A9I9E7T3_CUCME
MRLLTPHFINHINLTLAPLIPFHQEHESFLLPSLLRFILTSILRLSYCDVHSTTTSRKFPNSILSCCIECPHKAIHIMHTPHKHCSLDRKNKTNGLHNHHNKHKEGNHFHFSNKN